MLIGFFTNRDVFLNKLIPMLSVYLEQTKQSQKMFNDLMKKPQESRSEDDVKLAQKTFNETYEMAGIILKELKNIQKMNTPVLAPEDSASNHSKATAASGEQPQSQGLQIS